MKLGLATVVSLIALLLASSLQSATATTPTLDPADRDAFIAELVEQHGFDRTEVEQGLAQAQFNQAVFEAIQRPWEAKPWHQYYPIFLTERRLEAGLKFWQEHQATLERAEQTYGVPAHIIVAIIGVETFYGSYKGNYKVLDALYTLGFHYPPRAKFFRSELREFFLMTREEQLPLTEIYGSYAGAMGYGQFISSSYRHYAVDFDGDGVRDLLTNPVDAIGSVANYFAKHGWQKGQPVTLELATHAGHSELVSAGLKYEHNLQQLVDKGLQLPADHGLDGQAKAKVFAFEQSEGVDHWLGLQNFYVITRYNHSPLYAMVVHQFSQQLKQGR